MGQVSELIEGADAAKLAGGNPLQVGLFTVGTANVSPIKGQSPKDLRWALAKQERASHFGLLNVTLRGFMARAGGYHGVRASGLSQDRAVPKNRLG